MNHPIDRGRWQILGAVALFSLSAVCLQGAPLKQAKVTQVVNDVNLLPNQAAPKRASVNDEVVDGTAVRTGLESRSELTFTDQTIARLGANTIFNFNEGTRSMELGGGAMLLRVPKGAGGAKITTSAVTAAITGTTVMLQFDRTGYAKFIVLEGQACLALKSSPSNCVPVKAGQLLSVKVNPPPDELPEPVDIDLSLLIDTSGLFSNDFRPLPSLDLIEQAIKNQEALKAESAAAARASGDILVGDFNETIDQRIAADNPLEPEAPEPPPPPQPLPTPDKFGPPATISSPNLSVIDSATAIQTDPSIARNGEIGFGKIYRDPTLDGPPGDFLFGATSAFDITSAFATGANAANLIPIAVFKFGSLQLAGNPTISTANGGVTKLALIGENSLTSNGPGGNLTFSGLDTLLLATQDGSINLGTDISISGINRVFIYARGLGRNLTIGSAITTPNDLRLYSQGTVQINGTVSAQNFSSFSGGDYLNGLGLITARDININSLGNLNFASDRFSNGSISAVFLSLRATNAVNLDVAGARSIFNIASTVNIKGATINLLSPNPVVLTFNLAASPVFDAGSGGIQGMSVGFAGNNISLLSTGGINIYSFDSGTPRSGTINAGSAFNGVTDFRLGNLIAGTSITVGGNLEANNINAGTSIGVGGNLTASTAITAGSDITADSITLQLDNTTGGTINTNVTLRLSARDITTGSLLAEIANNGGGGRIEGSAAVNLTARNLTADSVTAVINNTNISSSGGQNLGGTITGPAMIKLDVSGAIVTQDGVFLVVANDSGRSASDVVVSASAADVTGGLGAQINNGSGGRIDGSASISYTVTNNLSGDSIFAGINNPDGGSIGGNTAITLQARNITSATFLSVFVDNSRGGTIAGSSSVLVQATGTINVAGQLRVYGQTIGALGVNADDLRGTDVTSQVSINAGSTGIGRFRYPTSTSEIPDVLHTLTAPIVTSQGGINFDGINRSPSNGPSAPNGTDLVINADSLSFGPNGNIRGPVSFNGADAFSTFSSVVGDGGSFAVNTPGAIAVDSDIEATTGRILPAGTIAGAGGSVELNSSQNTVGVTSRIEVSSAQAASTTASRRRSARGGNIKVSSGRASTPTSRGVAINFTSSSQLLALLDAAAPGPGGKITILATGANTDVNANGRLEASKGTIDIRHQGAGGHVNVMGNPTLGIPATMSADVIKAGAFGANGQLMIGNSTLSADSLIRLYATGSNGELMFVANTTLSSGRRIDLAANRVTIQQGVVVNITGAGGPAYVFTNNANYSGFGGANSSNGTFGGNGAHPPQSLTLAPGFDDPTP